MKWFTFHCFESILFNSIIDTLAALYKMINNLLLIKALSSRWRQENHPPPQSTSASPRVDVAWCQHSAWPPSGLVMGLWWWTRPLPCAACDPALHTHTHTHVYTHTRVCTHAHVHTTHTFPNMTGLLQTSKPTYLLRWATLCGCALRNERLHQVVVEVKHWEPGQLTPGPQTCTHR